MLRYFGRDGVVSADPPQSRIPRVGPAKPTHLSSVVALAALEVKCGGAQQGAGPPGLEPRAKGAWRDAPKSASGRLIWVPIPTVRLARFVLLTWPVSSRKRRLKSGASMLSSPEYSAMAD